MSETMAEETARLRAAFDAEIARAGLVVAPDERDTLFEGYCGLQPLLAALPRAMPLVDEPALIAVAAGGRVVR
ncbi:MAG: hypothetical protein AB7F78_19440 [Hyphomicrobiaceae bacterium]